MRPYLKEQPPPKWIEVWEDVLNPYFDCLEKVMTLFFRTDTLIGGSIKEGYEWYPPKERP